MDDETLGDLLSTEPAARVPGGQAAEFRVWAEVIDQSAGALHVFLPLLDRGIDAVFHNLRTGVYTAVQVKSRSVVFHQSVVTLTIYADRLVDDEAVLIGVLRQDQGLGPMVLVVKEGRFRELATRSTFRGRSILSAYFSMHPTSRSRWGPDLVPLDRLAEQLLGAPITAAKERVPRQTSEQAREDPWRGFLGETEIIRRLAVLPTLELYRPFPDYEAVDLLVRNQTTRRFFALQVKTVTCAPGRRTLVDLGEPPFPISPDLWVVVLAWQPDSADFHSECLLIPSERLDEVTLIDSGKLVIQWRPGGKTPAHVDPFRRPLSDLHTLVDQLSSAGPASPLASDPMEISPSLPETVLTDPSPSAADLASLPDSTLTAVRTIEACMKAHHVVEIDYVNQEGKEESLRVQPAFIRWNTTHHLVLWAFSPNRGHWFQLWLDCIRAAQDTGETFSPEW